jgi:1-acyl-sn-glycerol-3-phosphate acyltransferase
MASSQRRSSRARFVRRFAFFLHLAGGLAIALAWFPLIGRAHRQKLKACWSHRLLAIVGLRLEIRGELAPGALIVSNHVSWYDIFAINAARPSAFVAKSEIAGWPLAGWLCRKADTIFIERGSHRHAQHVAHDMARRLAAGDSIAFFPEGTTTEGDTLLPFHAALFQPAIAAGAALQPVLIRYRDLDGRFTRAPAYAGETTFGESLSRTLAERGLTVQLTCLAPIPTAGLERRALAAQCRAAIAEAMAD